MHGSDNEYPGEGWQGEEGLQLEEGQDRAPRQCGEELKMTQVWSLRDWKGGGAINRNREVRRRRGFRAGR